MSCNGCRVLRKGCRDNCAIRPCLQWIPSPDAQGNATVFLTKFYGRAGLLQRISAGPQHLRPAIFRSLLYEACGRMLNPLYGSVGLLWTGNWQLCEAAVQSVLARGVPIAKPPLVGAATAVPPLRSCDIRHIGRREGRGGAGAVDAGLHRMTTNSRVRFKRSGAYRSSSSSDSGIELVFSHPSAISMLVDFRRAQPLNWAPRQARHEHSAASHDHDDGAVRESNSNGSEDTASDVNQSEPEEQPRQSEERAADVLGLTLGLPPTAPTP